MIEEKLNNLLRIAVSPKGAMATMYNNRYQIMYKEKFELPNKSMPDIGMLLLENDGIYFITKDKNIDKKLYEGFVIVYNLDRSYVMATIFNRLKYLKFNSYKFLIGCMEDISENEANMLDKFIEKEINKFVDSILK